MQPGYDLQQAGDEWARNTTQDPTKRMDAQAAFIAGAQWARARPIEIPGEDSAVAHAQPLVDCQKCGRKRTPD